MGFNIVDNDLEDHMVLTMDYVDIEIESRDIDDNDNDNNDSNNDSNDDSNNDSNERRNGGNKNGIKDENETQLVIEEENQQYQYQSLMRIRGIPSGRKNVLRNSTIHDPTVSFVKVSIQQYTELEEKSEPEY